MSPQKIQDEFSELEISTQMRYLMRQKKRGKCQACGLPAMIRPSGAVAYYCEAHNAYHNAYMRKYYQDNKVKKGEVKP